VVRPALVILTGDDVDMTIFPMFLHHEPDGQSYSDDNLVISKNPATGAVYVPRKERAALT